MNSNTITQRVERLREWMQENGLNAFIFPSTDPHNGEYIPDHWKTREWISGFNGSAGTAVVTMTSAALWTDSRYFLAAEEQLEGTPFQLMRQGLPDTPSITEWLGDELQADSTVGMDGMVNSKESVSQITDELEYYEIWVETDYDPTHLLWENRPDIPANPIEIQPIVFTGMSAKDKINKLRRLIDDAACDALLINQLDEIAWLLNLRGTDVHCNPVFVSYVFLTLNKCFLFINPDKLTQEVEDYLDEQGVTVKNYEDIKEILSENDEIVMTDTQIIPYTLYEMIRIPENLPSPTALLKAVKTEEEVKGYRSAMLKDGIALVKFLRWLKPAVEAGGETEMSIDRKLTSLRAEQPLYRDISFDTIAGYGPHGAIVHYEATPETDAKLEPRGLLLLDSGAQYQDGTTDITRTIALGPLTEEEKHDYTLVLRGHIRLAMAKFPAGTTGTQLDVCARYAMWQEGVNYLHGTGHGVGSYLNVHEGPHQIRMNYMKTPLQAHMTVTNEPGIYKAGKHGVRTENTMLITHYMDGEYGEFLQLEPLTLCPIDTTPILREEMQKDEIDYLNNYHKMVRETLLPHLTDEADREWLIKNTEQLTINN